MRTLLTLSRLLNKNWEETTKDDIDELIFKVMDQFADENGQETHYSYDHKKILKIFFRWYKLDSREFIQVCDPPEIKNVRVKKIKDELNSDQEILDSTKNSIKAIRDIQHN
ncbi:hypothetical protein [Nitrosopumilus ureiphilus]|uniref:hypothetical protein n=1 Tax=Nitrosopumilus ureiphilus TaxID=1470067 RepID=UPI0015CE5376|nr:hypothetical protein [Nitrosopumilus ureiphilus]